jgi:small-conductance mechanosensitive channel
MPLYPALLALVVAPTHRDIVIGVVLACSALLAGLFLHTLFFWLLAKLRHRSVQDVPMLRIIMQRVRRPALAIVLVTALGPVLPFVGVPAEYLPIVAKATGILWFLALGWLMVSSVYTFEDLMLLRYDTTNADNLAARRVRTQLQLFRRMAIILLLVVDAGLILSLFRDSQIWHYGAGLLASAGLASLVLATAAKSTAENMLAGLQIALTEPIRLDDVVIVEGEWGKIEEITTTYVVVAIWDYRRLVVPLTYFIEKPFQNWTRERSDLMGTSFLYVDYSVPVPALRAELTRLLDAAPLWDRKINACQVTNLSEHTMEIRCLMSARNAGDQFDLRCIIREGMIEFIQKNYPDAFPQTRFSATSSMSQQPGGQTNQSNHSGSLPDGIRQL